MAKASNGPPRSNARPPLNEAVRHRPALLHAEQQLIDLLEERARTVAMLDRVQTLHELPFEILA